jgi:hypothetical protein
MCLHGGLSNREIVRDLLVRRAICQSHKHVILRARQGLNARSRRGDAWVGFDAFREVSVQRLHDAAPRRHCPEAGFWKENRQPSAFAACTSPRSSSAVAITIRTLGSICCNRSMPA